MACESHISVSYDAALQWRGWLKSALLIQQAEYYIREWNVLSDNIAFGLVSLNVRGKKPVPSIPLPPFWTEIWREKPAENGIFGPQNTHLGKFLTDFFLYGKGGYPPPPLNEQFVAENLIEKVNGKGGIPPPYTSK